MAKRQEDRYTTAGDMARDLRAVLESKSQPGPSVPTTTPAEDAKTLLGETVPSSRRRRRQAERCQVTVLFGKCDLFDSDALLDKLDLEEQHELLMEYRHIFDEAIDKFGGTVVQSASEGLLACFGYPVSYEDAAQRAVRAGLRIRDGIVELNKRIHRRFGTDLSSWVGIHTGMAVAEETAGDKTTEPISLVGKVRTVVTRLGAAAEPNSVLITQVTHRLVQGFFICTGLGTHAIQGESGPLELFLVQHESEVKSRIEVAEAIGLTPLTGRDVELGILQDRWEKAQEGMGQVVLLIGDAGLGKSRLVRELRAGVSQSGLRLSGHSASQKSGEIGPLIEWRMLPVLSKHRPVCRDRLFRKDAGLWPRRNTRGAPRQVGEPPRTL